MLILVLFIFERKTFNYGHFLFRIYKRSIRNVFKAIPSLMAQTWQVQKIN